MITWQGLPSSPSLMSILLSSTYSLLSLAATSTNKSIKLGVQRTLKPRSHPEIRSLQRELLNKHKLVQQLQHSPSSDPAVLAAAVESRKACRLAYRQAIRREQKTDNIARDENLGAILSSNPGHLFKSIRNLKSISSGKIHSLKVSDRVYEDEAVPDGFYDSLSSLKAPDMHCIQSSPHFQNTLSDFENIMKICSTASKIPEITYRKSTEILLSLRADVTDFYSITAHHFINAGKAGFEHFFFLLSSLVKNVNLASLAELNTVWACILYKGHGKDRCSDRSYRTISTCPLLAKALDTYIGQLCESGWAEVQAPTQFQGSGSCHELAALLLTECIQHSIHFVKKPVFVLLLDAKSAFDKVVRQCAIRNAYLAGTTNQALLYLNARLEHRKTYIEWDKVLMGPISDKLGVEQGGVNSDKIYKLCNNIQLSEAQRSELGVDLGAAVVSSIGQADDTVLISDCLVKLYCLLHLAVQYCEKYHVELVPEKTMLLAFAPPSQKTLLDIKKLSNHLSLDGKKIDFSQSAEHDGILRAIDGNMPNILKRICSHTKAINAVLPTGMALAHSGNPAASLRLERLYGCPVLLSGLAALVLSCQELAVLHHHHKTTMQRLQRLHYATPNCVVYFLGGSLPIMGILHLRMLNLLAMIARLGPDNILHKHGRSILLHKGRENAGHSWFIKMRYISTQYGVPDPILVLQTPPVLFYWKNLTNLKVLDWWKVHLSGEAELLASLEFFKPSFMSLSSPHPVWTTARKKAVELTGFPATGHLPIQVVCVGCLVVRAAWVTSSIFFSTAQP